MLNTVFEQPYKVDYVTIDPNNHLDSWTVTGPGVFIKACNRGHAYEIAAAVNAAFIIGRNGKFNEPAIE